MGDNEGHDKPLDATLLINIDMPTLEIQAQLSLTVDVMHEEHTQIFDAVGTLVQEISEGLKDYVEVVDVEANQSKFDDLRSKAVLSLQDWRQRLKIADEWKAKAENAKIRMNEMREAYFKDLMQLREQLYRKEDAKIAGKDFEPADLIIFDPTRYSFDDEVGRLLGQKAQLLQQEFATQLAQFRLSFHERISGLEHKLSTCRFILDRKDRLLRALMDKHGYQSEQTAEQLLGLPSQLEDQPLAQQPDVLPGSQTGRPPAPHLDILPEKQADRPPGPQTLVVPGSQKDRRASRKSTASKVFALVTSLHTRARALTRNGSSAPSDLDETTCSTPSNLTTPSNLRHKLRFMTKSSAYSSSPSTASMKDSPVLTSEQNKQSELDGHMVENGLVVFSDAQQSNTRQTSEQEVQSELEGWLVENALIAYTRLEQGTAVHTLEKEMQTELEGHEVEGNAIQTCQQEMQSGLEGHMVQNSLAASSPLLPDPMGTSEHTKLSNELLAKTPPSDEEQSGETLPMIKFVSGGFRHQQLVGNFVPSDGDEIAMPGVVQKRSLKGKRKICVGSKKVQDVPGTTDRDFNPVVCDKVRDVLQRHGVDVDDAPSVLLEAPSPQRQSAGASTRTTNSSSSHQQSLSVGLPSVQLGPSRFSLPTAKKHFSPNFASKSFDFNGLVQGSAQGKT